MYSNVSYGEGDATHGGSLPRHLHTTTRKRNPMACLLCRKRKIKCEFNNGDVCDHCRSKNTKCTVLSVPQEEALKSQGYTDDDLTSMRSAEVERLLQHLPVQLHSNDEHDDFHRNPRPYPPYGAVPGTNPTLSSMPQIRSENIHPAYDQGGRVAPSPYNNSAHGPRVASCPMNPTTMQITTPHPHTQTHRRQDIHPNYTSPLPNLQMPYQIPAPGTASISHHIAGDHQLQFPPNISGHSNVGQSHNHADYSGQANYPFQAAQQSSQGQMGQYQYSGYPAAMPPNYAHDAWRR